MLSISSRPQCVGGVREKENISRTKMVLLCHGRIAHYDDVIRGAIAPQITSLTIVYSTVYSDADQRKHQNSASLAFVRGIHRGPVNSPHKWPVTRKIIPFDDSSWYICNSPMDTSCNDIVIVTSKWRRDVVITLLSRHISTGRETNIDVIPGK